MPVRGAERRRGAARHARPRQNGTCSLGGSSPGSAPSRLTRRNSCSMCSDRLDRPRSRATLSVSPGCASKACSTSQAAHASSAAATCKRRRRGLGASAGCVAGRLLLRGMRCWSSGHAGAAAAHAPAWSAIAAPQSNPKGPADLQVGGCLQHFHNARGPQRQAAGGQACRQHRHAAVPRLQPHLVRRRPEAVGRQGERAQRTS